MCLSARHTFLTCYTLVNMRQCKRLSCAPFVPQRCHKCCVLFLLVPCCTGVRVRQNIVEPLFLFFLSIVFCRLLPLSIFHPRPIFSCPSSRSPPISAVAFPFSCVLDVFPPLLSLLVCLHPFLPSGLPISSCFSPIFLLGCIASQPLSLSQLNEY